MKINTVSIHFTADSKLLAFIEKKTKKLEQYFERIIRVDVFLKLENSGQVKDKIVELKVKVPGETLMAKESSKTFERATDMAVDNMTRQIKRYKDKMRPKVRRSQ
jgi:putative sigma-54 modulation protein